MYWIDVNLLNDREEFVPDIGPGTYQEQDSKAPMAIGLGVGVAAIAIAFGAYSITGFFNNKLTAEEAEIDQKISRLQPQVEDVEKMQAEVQTIQSQTDALAKIFNQIKPWSAMLSDLRDRIPSTLQIGQISQKEVAAAPANNGDNAPPPPSDASSALTISGSAISFGDVNDFLLTLRQSNYLSQDASQTKLKNATRQSSLETDLVSYEITTQVNNAPAESLLSALRLNGAAGLVSRIETLKRQGVIKP